MPVWVVVAVFAAATARLTALVTLDEITRPPRDAILRRLRDDHRIHQGLAYLLTCPHCASVWVGAATAPVAYWHGRNPWAFVPALALAFSWVAGASSNLGRSGD